MLLSFFFFFSSRRRHTRYWRDWSSDVCSSDLGQQGDDGGVEQQVADALDAQEARVDGGGDDHHQGQGGQDAQLAHPEGDLDEPAPAAPGGARLDLALDRGAHRGTPLGFPGPLRLTTPPPGWAGRWRPASPSARWPRRGTARRSAGPRA